jgi:hypothetical protein
LVGGLSTPSLDTIVEVCKAKVVGGKEFRVEHQAGECLNASD